MIGRVCNTTHTHTHTHAHTHTHTPIMQFMFEHLDGIRKVMIVDFDAHQVTITSLLSCNIYRLAMENRCYCIFFQIRATVMKMISAAMREFTSWTCTIVGSTPTTGGPKVCPCSLITITHGHLHDCKQLQGCNIPANQRLYS